MQLLETHRQTHLLVVFSDPTCNFSGNTEADSPPGCFSGPIISHAMSQEIQRQTHSLNMFSCPMISHATSQQTQRQTHQLDVFQEP